MGPSDTTFQLLTNVRPTIVGWDPKWLTRLVGEVLRAVKPPNKLVKDLLVWFCVKMEDGISMPLEGHKGWRLSYFSGNLGAIAELVPGFSQMALLPVYCDGILHLLHLLLSIPVGVYYIVIRLLAFGGDLPETRLYPVVDI